jgi:hypothetical protein
LSRFVRTILAVGVAGMVLATPDAARAAPDLTPAPLALLLLVALLVVVVRLTKV